MVLVDSSVWIDYFNGKDQLHTDFLRTSLGAEISCTGNLIMTEVLQGFNSDKSFSEALGIFENLLFFHLGGLAVTTAGNFRVLRKKGITLRKQLILSLLPFASKMGSNFYHNDKDFEPFGAHLGLSSIF